MANNGSFNTNGYEVRYLTFEWRVANQHIDTNKTTIHWTLRGNGGNTHIWYMSGNFKVVIEGSTVYQSATRIKLQGNTVVASGEFNVGHNHDGTKRFSASVEAGIYYFAVNSRGNGSWDLPTIARSTQPTVNKTTVAFGESLVISCPRASASFTHTIQASVDGKLGHTTIGSNVGTSHTWTIPKSWGRYLTHSTDKLKIRVLTYSGGIHIGTKEVPPITVTPTGDMAPVVVVTLTDANNIYNTYGGFVKGQSKIKASVSEILYEQAVVTSRSLVLNGITYQSNNQTSEIIMSTSQSVTARVTDSRGLTGTKAVTPIVHDWYAPRITMAKANRCRSDGTLDESGTHIKLEYTCAIAPVNQRNQKNLSYSYKIQNSSSATTKTIMMENYTKTGSVTFPASGESSWEVSISLKDAFTTSKVTLLVGTAFVLLDFHRSGKGIGVGKVSERMNRLELSPLWEIGYRNEVIKDFVISNGIQNQWTWRKWYSGVMEMWSRVQVTVDVTGKWGALFTSGTVDSLNRTYPIHFVVTPTVIANLSKHSYAGFLMSGGGGKISNNTQTGAFEIVRGTEAKQATFTVDYYVVGRWK